MTTIRMAGKFATSAKTDVAFGELSLRPQPRMRERPNVPQKVMVVRAENSCC
jgi:hypothetical protein